MYNDNNPFMELSNLFVENQRLLNVKTEDVLTRAKSLKQKMITLTQQLESDVFSTDLVAILNVDDEARLLLTVAKELEFQRDQILNSIKMLSQSKEIKLNK
jgi:hypothetical protein